MMQGALPQYGASTYGTQSGLVPPHNGANPQNGYAQATDALNKYLASLHQRQSGFANPNGMQPTPQQQLGNNTMQPMTQQLTGQMPGAVPQNAPASGQPQEQFGNTLSAMGLSPQAVSPVMYPSQVPPQVQALAGRGGLSQGQRRPLQIR